MGVEIVRISFMWPWAREVILEDFGPLGGLWRRILEDFLALGASWPRPELARAGGS